MRFSDYKATRMNDNNGQKELEQGQQQQGGNKEPSAAQLLQRYRKNVAKDRKADKYMNQKVDLAEAAWAAKPSTYYAQMDQLIAQAREEEAKRQEEEVVVVVEKEEEQQENNKYHQPTYHQNNMVPTTEYIDEKIAYVEASMQEKLLKHRQCTASDCAMAGSGHVGAHGYNNLVYIVLGTLICLFIWWKSQVARKSVNDTRISKEKKANEDGWEDVVVVVNKSPSCSTDLKDLAKEERVLVLPDDKLAQTK